MKTTVMAAGVATLLLAVSPVHAQCCGQEHAAKDDAAKTEKAPEKEIKVQTTCPVMGGAIDKSLYVDHDGKRIYMCCAGCEEPLKKDAGKYIKQMEEEGITVAKVQTECPVMGRKIDKSLYVEHDGKRVYVCCRGCIGAVRANPARFVKALEEAGVTLDDAGSKRDKDAKAKKQ